MRRIHPRLAVGRDRGGRRRRGRPVRERRLVRARRDRRDRRGRGRARSPGFITPFDERVAVDCTLAQLDHHTVRPCSPARLARPPRRRRARRRRDLLREHVHRGAGRGRAGRADPVPRRPLPRSPPPSSGRSPAGDPSTPHELRDGVVAGAALLLGYVLQTIGLQYTSSATSAFITYLLVVFVPILGFVAPRAAAAPGDARRHRGRGRRPRAPHRPGRWRSVEPGSARASCSRSAARSPSPRHVVILGETAHRHDPVRLAAVQVTVVGRRLRAPGLLARWLRLPGAAPSSPPSPPR